MSLSNRPSIVSFPNPHPTSMYWRWELRGGVPREQLRPRSGAVAANSSVDHVPALAKKVVKSSARFVNLPTFFMLL